MLDIINYCYHLREELLYFMLCLIFMSLSLRMSKHVYLTTISMWNGIVFFFKFVFGQGINIRNPSYFVTKLL